MPPRKNPSGSSGQKTETTADILVCDLRGLKCPLPVLKTRRRLKELAHGTVLRVETTDPLAGIDIPHLCREDGHDLVSAQRTESGHVFTIRKSGR